MTQYNSSSAALFDLEGTGTENELKALLKGFSPKLNIGETNDFIKELESRWNQSLIDYKNATIDKTSDVLTDAINAIKGQEIPSSKSEFIPTPSATDLVMRQSSEQLKEFDSFYYPIEKSLEDGCRSVITETNLALQEKKCYAKFINAAKAYAYDPRYENPNFTSEGSVKVLFDTTVFGSGKTGFCFTNTYVVFKGISSYPHELYFYKDIENITIKAEILTISGVSSQGKMSTRFHYINHKITKPLTNVCEALLSYISQPSYQLLNYLKRLS